jgi:hypothetical protein
MATSASEWVRFFEDASIPKAAAAEYAVAFCENRISKQMLGDLNKAGLHFLSTNGTYVIIFKIFLPQNSAKNWRF